MRNETVSSSTEMKKLLKILSRVIVFLFLSILTQVGGVFFLISLLINKSWKREFRFKLVSIFIPLYLVFTLAIIPVIAPVFGREAVKNSEFVVPSNFFTILLNRNYVKPQLNDLLQSVSSSLKGEDITISYLDANFPFINKFPLLPHLSHNDGKKIDVSLIYENDKGQYSDKQKSNSGYGVFEDSKPYEFNQTTECLSKGCFQYDYPKFLTLGRINNDLTFSNKGTKTLVQAFLKNETLGKIFIEPHLKTRLKLTDPRIRFQGCRAVRHDDHIHIQLK